MKTRINLIFTVCFSCKRNKCITKINEDNQLDIFNKFHSLITKNEQDIYLQSLIDCHDIKQRRPRKEEGARENSKSFKYYVLFGSTRMQVCFKAYLSLHSVKKKRIERLRRLKVKGELPVDKRGFHVKQSVPEETQFLIRQHIESFPTKESHYLGKPIQYLDATLSVKQMYILFKEKCPGNIVGFTYFFNYFRENYNLSFGRPQVDTCCKCEELNVKIKNPHLNEAAKRSAQAELDVHKRQSKKFYNRIKADKEDEANGQNKHILSLCFDFMQNIQIPRIPVQETFYLRQLSVNVFCMHNIKSNKANLYVYHQGVARKGPDEVCSMLLDYLKSLPTPNQYTELHLYSDNCWGQNKNHAMCRLLLAVTELKLFEKIEQFYPVRGHSFLPCDRDFGTMKKELNRYDRLFTVNQICNLIKESSRIDKFTVKELQTSDVLDFQEWWPNFYKKNPISLETMGKKAAKDKKVHFSISGYSHCTYRSSLPGVVLGRPYIDAIVRHTFNFKNTGRLQLKLAEKKAYPAGKVPLKKAKLDDIMKLQAYIPQEFEEFYGEIYTWPTTTDAIEDD